MPKADEIRKLAKVQTMYANMMNKIQQWLTVTKKKVIKLSALQIRMDQADAYYSKWMASHETIIILQEEDVDLTDDSADLFKRCIEFEELYTMVKSTLFELIEEKRPSTGQSVSHNQSVFNTSSQIKLPKLRPPTFSGSYCNWMDFRSEFKSMIIDNDELGDIEKFKFLKSSLTDGAQRIISNMEASQANFKSAWQALCDRYENKSLIFQSHINEILNMNCIRKESSDGLREIIDIVSSHQRALSSLGESNEIAENFLICIMLSKMDNNTVVKWEESTSKDIPTWEQFCTFLEKRSSTLEKIDYNKKQTDKSYPSPVSRIKTANKSNHSAFISVSPTLNCKKCNSSSHSINNCPQFIELRPTDRFHELRRLRLCTVCMSSKHRSRICKGAKCGKCRGRHHTLIHFDEGTTSTPPPTQNALVAENAIDDQPALLATVVIDVKDKYGNKIPCRALLDSCASSHFVSDHLVNILGVDKFQHHKNISGIGTSFTMSKFACEIELCSRFDDSVFMITAALLPRITGVHPSRPISTEAFVIPDHLTLADPLFYRPQNVDLLIGAGLFWHLLLPGQMSLGTGLPVMQHTKFGWILSGAFDADNTQTNALVSFEPNIITKSDALDKLVSSFWEIEEISNDQTIPMSIVNQECENFYDIHTRRSPDGKFIVRLPFFKDPSHLGRSCGIAKRRFLSLEKRLDKQPDAKKLYVDFIEEYERLNHLEEVHNFDSSAPHYFLPHHNVMKLSSSSTKLRVVFDASCKTSSGVSLNDILHTGPKLQDDLFVILLRFRLFQYVVTADIQKMYRQVLIDKPDTNFQLIFWRSNRDDPIRILRLLTVTYGTAPGAYLAIKTLNRLSEDGGAEYPVGAKVLRHHFYVDDMMVGASSLEELHTICNQTSSLLKQGGFTLSKFCSNNKQFLDTVDVQHREKFLRIDDNEVVKALGLIWNPDFDCFLFSHQPSSMPLSITKRIVLSEMASLFDPLGLICPVITLSKVFYQDLWKMGLDWDDTLPSPSANKWAIFRQQLDSLKDIAIPRFVLGQHNFTFAEIHGFADASEKAYGACVYIRCGHLDNSITCRLLCAKSKVAPTKTLTVARLELLAAKLLSDLVVRVMNDVLSQINISSTYLWTDSLIVLNWLRAEPHLWNIFVAHRVAKIQQSTSGCQWRHVPGNLNPADLISRGMLPSEISMSQFWFEGPAFLQECEDSWPGTTVFNPNLLEERKKQEFVLVAEPITDITDSINFSVPFRGVRRVFAYVRRFILNCRKPPLSKDERRLILGKPNYDNIPLPTLEEEDIAEEKFIRDIQRNHFAQDYQLLLNNLSVSSKSRLKGLAPFLDDNGLIRVGGRIKRANIPYDAKHQILLPSNHNFTRSVISYFHHFRSFHSGPHIMLTAIRARWWPINGLQEARRITHHCVWCFRMKPQFFTQIMGELPKERLDYRTMRPFVVSGVDFAGPFTVKHHIRCRVLKKVYVAVFVCFTTKAIHLELIIDLSTDAFLRGLKRFAADVGTVKKIYSDNATNFQGTANQLTDLKRSLKKDERHIKWSCNQSLIEWSFIPPRSPNFGGLWEASVKIVKKLMRNVIGNTELTVDELHTLVRQVATIVNSRPITPISSDPNDLEPLTPGHFVYGGPPTALPESYVEGDTVNRVKLHQRLSWINQTFWRRFRDEYLNLLQNRNKWIVQTNNICVGTMVLLKDDLLPPLKWSLGKVSDVNPDSDGIVRVLKIRTAKGEYTRSVSGVAVLPFESN